MALLIFCHIAVLLLFRFTVLLLTFCPYCMKLVELPTTDAAVILQHEMKTGKIFRWPIPLRDPKPIGHFPAEVSFLKLICMKVGGGALGTIATFQSLEDQMVFGKVSRFDT